MIGVTESRVSQLIARAHRRCALMARRLEQKTRSATSGEQAYDSAMTGVLAEQATLDLVDELVRRMAVAGHGGRIEIEHDREQRTIKVRGHSIYSRSELGRFDPPAAIAAAS
jgi:hypothetical protein